MLVHPRTSFSPYWALYRGSKGHWVILFSVWWGQYDLLKGLLALFPYGGNVEINSISTVIGKLFY